MLASNEPFSMKILEAVPSNTSGMTDSNNMRFQVTLDENQTFVSMFFRGHLPFNKLTVYSPEAKPISEVIFPMIDMHIKQFEPGRHEAFRMMTSGNSGSNQKNLTYTPIHLCVYGLFSDVKDFEQSQQAFRVFFQKYKTLTISLEFDTRIPVNGATLYTHVAVKSAQ